LRALRDRLAAEADERGLRLLPSATAPLADDRPPRFTPDARYQRMSREFGALARASLTCACHVHLGIPDRATGLTISNHVRSWLPLLLALTANSPFQDGADTRYASWRYMLWRGWPSAGPPPAFGSVDEYESSVAGLLRTGAAIDRGMIYWDIRLSAHQQTLETRIADIMPTVEEAALLAVLVRALAGQALDGVTPPDVPQEVLTGRLWRAARDGAAGRGVDPRTGDLVPTLALVDDLVRDLRPFLRATGDDDHVTEVLARLRTTGCGADRQRAVYARRRSITDVVDRLVWPTNGG
jgi:carboxylate-amine ligase